MKRLSLRDPGLLAALTTNKVIPAPLPSDYWHESNSNYSAGLYAPQQEYVGTGGGSFGLINNQLVLVPFFVGRAGRTVSQLGAVIVGTPSFTPVLKLGIYNCKPPSAYDVYPQNLIASVNLPLALSAGRQMATLPTPVSLENGLYWLAVGRVSGSMNVRAINSSGFNLSAAGRNPLQWNASTGATQHTHLQVALADGSPLPATLPTGGALTTSLYPMLEVA